MTSKKHILIIEDDALIMQAYKIGLEQEDFQVSTAENGHSGLSAILKGNIDLILLDLILPKKDGFEILEALQKNKQTDFPPIIVLSNLGQSSDIERAKKLGASDYLIKANTSMKDVIEKVK